MAGESHVTTPKQAALLPPDEPARSWRRRLSERLWGYDYFVSYHWASGGAYAVALAQRLRDLGYDVFLDRAEYAMGDDWKGVGERALRRTQRLVLVATPEAVARSQPVAHEVRAFTARGRQVIAVVFSEGTAGERRSTLADLSASECPVLALMPDTKLHIEDELINLGRGPAEGVVQQLTHTHRVMRRRDVRAMVLGVLVAVLIGFAAFATASWGNAVFAYRTAEGQRKEAVLRERQARHEQGVSWLARSAASERRRDYLAAKLMAMKAIAFAGFGPDPAAEEELLRPDSSEYKEAIRRIVSLPEADLLYVARLRLKRQSAYVQCVFNRLGTEVTGVSSDGRMITIDFQKGTAREIDIPTASLLDETAPLRLRHAPTRIDSKRIAVSNGLSAKIELKNRRAAAVWKRGLADAAPPITRLADGPALWNGANDDDPELAELVAARDVPIIVATFQSRYVHSVAAFDHGNAASLIYQKRGEMSDDSGVARSASSCISDDGTIIVLSETNRLNDADNRLTIFKKASGGFKPHSTMIVDGPALTRLTVSLDKRLIAAVAGKTIQVWNVEQSRVIATFTGHTSPVTHVDFSPDSLSIASASEDGTIMVWGMPYPADEWVDATKLSRDLRLSILGDEKAAPPHVAALDTMKCSSPGADLTAHWKETESRADLGEEERYGELVVTDTETKGRVLRLSRADVPSYTAMRFSGDGRHLMLTEEDGKAVILPIPRPRRGLDYKSAYAFTRFGDAGCEFTPELDTENIRRMAVPRRLSSVFLSETVPRASLRSALEWHRAALGRPLGP